MAGGSAEWNLDLVFPKTLLFQWLLCVSIGIKNRGLDRLVEVRPVSGTVTLRAKIITFLIQKIEKCKCNSWKFISGKKKNININFLARISRRHSWPLRPNALGSKSFSPPPGPQENALFGADVHDFRRGRPWPEALLKNFVQKKFALIFWPL